MSGPKITREDGRESLEEFGTEQRAGERAAARETSALEAAAGAFPNEGERTTPPDITTGGPGSPAGTVPNVVDETANETLSKFKFLECDPLIPGDEPEPCAVCRENEYAYVPDYTIMENGEVFFDGKKCLQSIVLTAASPNKGGPDLRQIRDPSYQREMKEKGIRLMLDYFNKSDVATVYYYVEQPPKVDKYNIVGGAAVGLVAGLALGVATAGVGAVVGAAVGTMAGGTLDAFIPPPVPGYALETEERDVVKELLPYTEFDYVIPLQSASQTRVLISVSVEYLNRVPTRAVTDPETDFETDLEVTIEQRDFYPMFRRAARAFKVYANQLDRWTTIEGGSLIEKRTASADEFGNAPENNKFVFLDLRTEAEKLLEFRDNIGAFVKQQGFSFRGLNQIDKITFKFERTGESGEPNSKIRLRRVAFNKPGCPDIVFSKNGRFKGEFNKLVDLSPMKQSRTLHYVGALPEIDSALQAREAMPWLEFVTKFTYPGLEVYYGGNTNSVLNHPSLAGCFADSFLGDEDFSKFMQQVGNIGLGLPDAILHEFYKSTCKTRDEELKDDSDLSRIPDALQRALEEQKRQIALNDPYLNIVVEELLAGAAMSKATSGIEKSLKSMDPEYKKGSFRKDLRTNLKEDNMLFWGRLNSRLGCCGWAALVQKAMDCVAQGLGEESAIKALTEAAFKNMDDRFLEKILRGLPPEDQAKIAGLVAQEFGDLPAPWDMDYVAGSMSGPAYTRGEQFAAEDQLTKEKQDQMLEDALFDTAYEQSLLLAIADLDDVLLSDVIDYYAGASTEELEAALEEAQAAHTERTQQQDEEYQQEQLEDGAPADPPMTQERYEGTRLTIYEGVLRRGDVGDDVKALQQILIALEYLDDGEDDRDYGPKTEDAVEAVQSYLQQQGFDAGMAGQGSENPFIIVDGQAGSRTHEGLNALYNKMMAESQGYEYDLKLNYGWRDVELEDPFGGVDPFAEDAPADAAEEAEESLPTLPDPMEPPPPPGPTPPPTPTDSSGGVFGIGYGADGTFDFGDSPPGSGGTYGTALGKVQKAIFDAYRNAILKTVGADVLLNELNKLPGAPIIAQFVKYMPCKPVPPWQFNPRMDSFLSNLEAEFCKENCGMGLSIPKTSGGPEEGDMNIFTLLYKIMKRVILDALVAVFMMALKLILSKVLSLACDTLAALGTNLLDLYDGNDHFKNLLHENMCPDADLDDLYDSLKEIFSTLGGPEASCLESLSNSEMADFLDDLSMMLTQDQVLQLLMGTATSETIALAVEVASISESECIREVFEDPSAFKTFFPSLSIFLPNLADVKTRLRPNDLSSPVFARVCTDDQVKKIDDIKCRLLGKKGLSYEECRGELDKAKDKALQDFNDLINLLENGPYANLPPINGDGETTCPSNGFFPTEDPVLADFAAGVTNSLFESVEERHLRDLMGPINWATGQGGLLNAILADTKGRPFKHHNWMVRFFGAPLAGQLGFFEWASDNAIRPPDGAPGKDKVPRDIYGNMLKNEGGVNQGKGASWFGYSEGGYPPTVGAWFAKTLAELEPEFVTRVTPPGYSSPSEAIDDFEQVVSINQIRIQRRKDYIEAFIDEFDLEGRGTWSAKFSQAAADLRNGIREELFGRTADDKAGFFSDNSPQQRAWKVLRGKDISIAGQSIGKPPDKWKSGRNRKRAGTKGAVFVDYWSAGNKFKLLKEPETSSADMVLRFEDYGEAGSSDPLYSYDLEYDYNLFDEDGALLIDGDYNIKVTETIKPPTSRAGKLKKKDIKKLGGEIPGPSIMDEGEYTYTSYDIRVPAAPSPEILEYLSTLDMSEQVKDSFQVEAFYKFISLVLTNASGESAANELVAQKEFRDYFAKQNKSGEKGRNLTPHKLDEISAKFLKKIASLISTGKVDLNTSEDSEPDDEPGFLEPSVPDEEQTKKEEKTAEQIGLEYISPAFLFGYDPYDQPDVIFLDNETYGGLRGRLFPDSTPPPFYVQDSQHTGWMDIYNALVPEVDGCDPARKQLLNLDDIKQSSSQLGSSLVNDKRLEFDPACAAEAPYDRIMTSYDAGNIDGAIRSIIRVYVVDAFIRAIPVFMQFGLTDENYDDALLSFMAERIKQGLYQDGVPRSGVTDDEFYYRVLEQCVNCVVRKIDSGILSVDSEEDFNEEELAAIDTLVATVDDFYTKYDGELESLSDIAIRSQSMLKRWLSSPATAEQQHFGYANPKFSKVAAKLAKKTAFEETIKATEKEATVFLKRYIKEEFQAIGRDFSQRFPPRINNIHHLFLLNDTWIRGGVFGDGPFDVQSDPTNPSDFNISNTIPTSVTKAAERLRQIGMASQADALLSAMASDDNWPFVLEKYIRIEDKAGKIPKRVAKRSENLYGVVNINDWDEYIKDFTSRGEESSVLNISDLWGNPENSGETERMNDHLHNYEMDAEGNGLTSEHTDAFGNAHTHEIVNGVVQEAAGHTHDIPVYGWKFGLRLSYLPSSKDREAFEEIVDQIGEDKIMREKAFKLENSSTPSPAYLIPIASAELPIPDQRIELYDPEAYDVYCLIEELVKTIEYKTMFEYIFPLSRFTSFLAIYSILGFYASLGNSGWPRYGGDMWENKGGNAGKKFRKWIRGPQTFKRTRKVARNLFTTLYEASQAIDFEHENKYGYKDNTSSIRDRIRPKVNFEDGLRWWQRGRKISRPYNMNGEECE